MAILKTRYTVSDRRLTALQSADANNVIHTGKGITARTLTLMARGTHSWGDLLIDTVDGQPVVTGIRLNALGQAARVRGQAERAPQPQHPARTSAYETADPFAVFATRSITDDLPF